MSRLADEYERAQNQLDTAATCTWLPDENGIYATECGHMFTFEHGTRADNHAVYCQYCGKRIKDGGK